jgi:archaellum component FlaC
MMSLKIVTILLVIVLNNVEGFKSEKRYQDINQAFGQYSGPMIGKKSITETKESDEVIKRYQDINQAFGQYSGPMIGKKSITETKENEVVIKKRYQDINQAFGQYSGPMIGRRVQSEDKSTKNRAASNFNIAFGNCQNGQSVDGARVAFSNCGGAQSTQGIFGQGGFFSKQQKGFGYGKRSVVETTVLLNETKKEVDENERQSRQYSSPVTYQQCLLLSTTYYNPSPVYYSYKPLTQQTRPIVYTSVNTLNRVPEVQIGGVYTGAMIGKRRTESILDKCRRTYPSLQYKQYTTYATTASSYYQQTYNNNGLFSVFDNFKYIFGKRDAVESE